MPSNKRQRELARRRAERQATRRAAERVKKRKRRTVVGLTVAGAAAAVVLILSAAALLKSDKKSTDSLNPSESPTPTAGTTVACGGTAPTAPKKQTFPKEPAVVVDAKKTYTAHMKTSCGEIVFDLFADKAPHTVNSFAFLAGKNFYDGTFCHRMTSSPGLTVLQCGDPEGTGAGGPGYTLPEENLKGAKYTRGLVAMAKTNAPHSTGSQFFLIDKDSDLPPDYTVVGKMTDDSLKVLDKILALGIETGTDGPPKQKVYVESFTVEAK